jgi:hypothetical protein
MRMARARLILINIAVIFCLIVLLEVICAQILPYWTLPSQVVTESLPSELSENSSATHIPFNLPPKLSRPSYPTAKPISTQKHSEPWTVVKASGCNSTFQPYYRTRATLKTIEGESIFDVHYTKDAFDRRVYLDGNCTHRKKYFLFFGCSFTYGEGVNDDETLPAQVALQNPSYQIYNYSKPGWSPGNILRRINESHLAPEIIEKKGKAVYVFMEDHLRRVVGNMSLDQPKPGWTDTLPYYFLDDKDDLQTRGMLYDGRGAWGPILRLLAQSNLLRLLNVDYPKTFSEKHFLLFSKIIAEIKKSLSLQLPEVDFLVAFFPESVTAKNLIPYLDREGIRSLDFSAVRLNDYVENSSIETFSHPSAASYKFVASLISDALKNDRSH